jgi:Domain of unknown function (DUF4129)
MTGVVVAFVGAGGDLPPLEHDPAEIRRTAEEILARPEYAPPPRSWLERILDWLDDRLDWVFPDSLSIGGAGGSTFFTLLLLAAVVVLVVFLLRHWRRIDRRRDDDALSLEIEEERSATEWETAALRAEAAGNWKEGLRCRFGALVGRLAAAGAVPPVPGRTAGEFRADIRVSVPSAAGDFADAADLFERAWYGDLPTGAAEAERFAADAGRVLAAERAAR